MEIVGHCPRCGAPIYAEEQEEWLSKNTAPNISFTCECRNEEMRKIEEIMGKFYET